MAELRDILPRHRTPEVRNPDGSTTITVQRCCNGCGYSLGDVTMTEIDCAIAGAPLPGVRKECPQCRPSMDPPLPAKVVAGGAARPSNAPCWVSETGYLCGSGPEETDHA